MWILRPLRVILTAVGWISCGISWEQSILMAGRLPIRSTGLPESVNFTTFARGESRAMVRYRPLL